MGTIREIVQAARQLKPEQLRRLRKQLDALEEKLWQKELAATTRELQEAGITDEDIDRCVIARRRRESRS